MSSSDDDADNVWLGRRHLLVIGHMHWLGAKAHLCLRRRLYFA